MGSRLELHTLLLSILGSGNVYFQPPPTFQIQYPCIVYQRSDFDTKFANNNPYAIKKQYMITVIDANPDSAIPDEVIKLSECTFERHFTADNLNHDVFIIYF